MCRNGRIRPPRAVDRASRRPAILILGFVASLLSCAGASDDAELADDARDGGPGSSDEAADLELPAGAAAAPEAAAAGQVTVWDDEEPDPADVDVLHVAVKPGTEAFVIAGAKALLGALPPESKPAGGAENTDETFALRLASAQALVALFGWNDVVRIAEAVEVSSPIVNEEGVETTLREVTFETLTDLKGEWTSTWSVVLEGRQGACSVTAPSIGERRLLFMRVHDAEAFIFESVPVTSDDQVIGEHGLLAEVDALQVALAAGEGVTP
jgi:hypothetical protein